MKGDKYAIVVGDASVDILVNFPIFHDKERKNVEFTTPKVVGGGTAANTAVALSKLGIKTNFIGTIGNDTYGKLIIEEFNDNKINTENLIVDNEVNTVGVFAFIDEYGERYLWGWPRTKQNYKKIDFGKINLDHVKNSSWLHASGMSFVDNKSASKSIIRLFKIANELGIPTSFDLNLRVDNGIIDLEYKKIIEEVLEYTDYIFGSADEEYRYLGQSEDWHENILSYLQKGKTIIVRQGKGSTLAFYKDESITCPTFEIEVEDTVGAGDNFNAGFIYSRINELDLFETLKIANAVAAYSVSKEGARNTPNNEQLEEFIRRNNNE